MTNNIVQVDVAKIDNEILDLKSQIDKLTTDLEIRLSLKKYIDSITVNKSTGSEPKEKRAYGGVSDFIISFLENGEKDTKVIIQAYADNIGSTYAKVGGNISNALSRLKTAEKINNKVKEGGRKAGSVWFLTTDI